MAVHLGFVPAARAERTAVVVHGNAQPHDVELVEAAVRTAAAPIAAAVFSPPELEGIMACLGRDRPWACFAATARAKAVTRIVVVRIERARDTLTLTEQVLVDGDDVPSIDRRFCDPCSDGELARAATELTTVLLQRTAARRGTTAITIATDPPGAVVTFDGTMLGETRRIATTPGEHRLLLHRSGYQPATRTVRLAAGETLALAVTLIREGAPPHPTRPSRVFPGIVLGAGVVAVIAGLTLQATKDPPASGPQPEYLYSAPGIALAIGGGVAIAAGVYLWVRTSHDGATVGWTGRF
jgi:hypothetical protein